MFIYKKNFSLKKLPKEEKEKTAGQRESCDFLHGDDKADLTEAGLGLQCVRNDTFLRSM